MTVITASSLTLAESEYAAIKLARYAQIVGYSECRFWGVNSPDDVPDDACATVWTKPMRDMVAHYLLEAQDEIEQVTGYPLAPRWFENEQHPCRSVIHVKRVGVIAAGVRAVTDIEDSASVDYTNEPAEIVVTTTVTDESEIHIYHPGSDAEIDPSSIAIASGTATILIPRCRLVLDAKADNPPDGWDDTDDNNFETEVDVKRVYNDPSQQGTLVYPHHSSNRCSCVCATCDEFTEPACVYVRNGETGALDGLRANYSGGVWKAKCTQCYGLRPEYVRVNYRAGLLTPTPQVEDAIVRLAHAKMPSTPCGCGPVHEMWGRDRHIPDVLDAVRLTCPFGLSDGSWIAWKFANALAAKRMSVL